MTEKNYFSDYVDETEKNEEEIDTDVEKQQDKEDNYFSSYVDETATETIDIPKEDNYFSDYVDESQVGFDETKVQPTTTPIYTPPKEEITYEQFKQSPELVSAAMRFAKNRLGYDKITEEDAVDEVIEHFREFKVNELVAGKDWGYISAAVTDEKRDEINDYKSLYRATESLENFSGGVATTLADYGWGIATAPSTLVGLLLPGGGKLSGVAAQQLS